MYTFAGLLAIGLISYGMFVVGIKLDISAKETPENVIKDTHASPDISHVMFIPLGDMAVTQVNDGSQVIWKARPGQACAHFRVYSLYGEKRLAHAKIVKVVRDTQILGKGTGERKSRHKSESSISDSEPFSPPHDYGKGTLGKKGGRARLFSDSTIYDQKEAIEDVEIVHFEYIYGAWTYLTHDMYNHSFLKLQTERILDLSKSVSPVVFSKKPCASVAGEAIMIVPYTKFNIRAVFYGEKLLWSSDRINHEVGKCEYAVVYENSIISNGTLEDVQFVKLYVRYGGFAEHIHFYKMGKEWTMCSSERFSDLLMEHGERVQETKL